MRPEWAGAVFAAVLALAIGAASAPPPTCDPSAGMNGKYVKPSSLAPGERAYNNAYGAPIAKPIVTRRVHQKAKTQPQLHSTPLPPA